MNLTQVPALPKLIQPRPFAGQYGYISTLSDNEQKETLTNEEAMALAILLWNTHSGYYGALTNGSAVLGDNGIYKYAYSGSTDPRSVRYGVIRMSNFARDDIRATTNQMVNGEKSEDEWYRDMRKILIALLLASWLTGLGGVSHYDLPAQEMFVRKALPQFRWLDNFASKINAGTDKMDGRTVVRAGMYGRAPYAMYQTANLETARRNDFREGRRVLGETDNHCYPGNGTYGCVELALLGFVPIDRVIPIGEGTTCRNHCLCHLEFRK
jgi:hypothetical protein